MEKLKIGQTTLQKPHRLPQKPNMLPQIVAHMWHFAPFSVALERCSETLKDNVAF